MSQEFSGGCLCASVRYVSGSPARFAGHCHCEDCRRTSGTGHSTHVVAAEAGFSVDGEVKVHERQADSGNLVRRAFCPECGSPIYSTNAAMPGMVFIRASSLDDPEIAVPTMIVYASRAASWDHMDPNLPSFAIMPDGGPQQVLDA